MTRHSIRSSRPDHWTSPRPYSDPSLRALAYGPIRPMHEPGWWERAITRLLGKS